MSPADEANSEMGTRQLRAAQAAGPRRRSEPVQPVFVITAARSGSTLLRYLLDSHPEIVSPPELNLSALLEHLVGVWSSLNFATAPMTDGPATPEVISPEIIHHARAPVDELISSAARAAGASIYVDKSLPTVDHLKTIAQCYPEAKLVFLYRYPLDMMASGLEASKWGFNAFGFTPFVAANPGNFIAALGNYWLDRTTKMLAFERTCELANARVYYELLCDDPAGTLGGLFEFLGLDADEQLIDRMFDSQHGRGPGDYKIDFSGRIGVESIGRGAHLPETLGADQVARINELLVELEYPSLEQARRTHLGALLELSHTGASPGESARIAQAVAQRLSETTPGELAARHGVAFPFDVLVRDDRGERSWVRIIAPGRAEVIDERGPQNRPVHPTVRCAGDVLIRVANGELSFGRAVHDNLIRVQQAGADEAKRPEPPAVVLAALAALLHAGS